MVSVTQRVALARALGETNIVCVSTRSWTADAVTLIGSKMGVKDSNLIKCQEPGTSAGIRFHKGKRRFSELGCCVPGRASESTNRHLKVSVYV